MEWGSLPSPHLIHPLRTFASRLGALLGWRSKALTEPRLPQGRSSGSTESEDEATTWHFGSSSMTTSPHLQRKALLCRLQ